MIELIIVNGQSVVAVAIIINKVGSRIDLSQSSGFDYGACSFVAAAFAWTVAEPFVRLRRRTSV